MLRHGWHQHTMAVTCLTSLHGAFSLIYVADVPLSTRDPCRFSAQKQEVQGVRVPQEEHALSRRRSAAFSMEQARLHSRNPEGCSRSSACNKRRSHFCYQSWHPAVATSSKCDQVTNEQRSGQNGQRWYSHGTYLHGSHIFIFSDCATSSVDVFKGRLGWGMEDGYADMHVFANTIVTE